MGGARTASREASGCVVSMVTSRGNAPGALAARSSIASMSPLPSYDARAPGGL
jgi:hypothetical protein